MAIRATHAEKQAWKAPIGTLVTFSRKQAWELISNMTFEYFDRNATIATLTLADMEQFFLKRFENEKVANTLINCLLKGIKPSKPTTTTTKSTKNIKK